MTHEEFLEHEEELEEIFFQAISQAVQDVDCHPSELDWFNNSLNPPDPHQ